MAVRCIPKVTFNLWKRTFTVNDTGATPTPDWTSVPVKSTACASLHDGAYHNGLDVVLHICEGQHQVEPTQVSTIRHADTSPVELHDRTLPDT